MTRDTRARLETMLPRLSLPKPGEPRPRFERRLDARLASLARLMDLSPSECVGLALWLGAHDWKAFDVDLSDCEANPSQAKFSRDLMISALDEGGRAKEAAPAIGKTMRAMGLPAPSDSSLRTYVAEHRAGSPEDGLQALYWRNESNLPVEHVKRIRREQLQRELRWSAARLTRG